jgi:hypothetical protein
MYKIIDRYKKHLLIYAHTKLDINGKYPKHIWLKSGFSPSVLEIC